MSDNSSYEVEILEVDGETQSMMDNITILWNNKKESISAWSIASDLNKDS